LSVDSCLFSPFATCTMSLCRLVLLFGALQCVSGMRIKKAAAAPKTKYIAGVPVYNYGSPVGIKALKAERDWILMLKSDVSKEQLERFCEPSVTTCTPEGNAGVVPFVLLRGTEDDLKQSLEAQSDVISFVEPEFDMHIIPDVPEEADASHTNSVYAATWGLDKVGVSRRTTNGEGVHVYVLDTGVRTTHSQFDGRAIPTLEVTSSTPQECHGSTSCARDVHGHGTHCAGTVGGSTYGVAPKATIHGVKVLSDSGTGSGSWTVAAIDWVVSKGSRPAVVSMSLGAKGNSYSDRVAIDAATRAGVTVVVAAGNENSDACGFSPAYVSSAITVGSTDSRDRRSSFSNYGRCVQIYAPGSSITSASHRSDTQSATMSGTSMACPHVSGAAALLLESKRGMSSTQVLSSMISNARSGAISGLTSSDPNKLLYVGGGGAGPVPGTPTPAPTPAPSTPTCPSVCVSRYPDSVGDCECPMNTWCSTTASFTKDCPYSGGIGGQTGRFFLHTCTTCNCYQSR
jgi:subtilisin family serine protease